MSAHFGQFGQMRRPSWLHRPQRNDPGATARRRGGFLDAVRAMRPGDAGLEARAWRRIHRAGLPQDGLTIEAWRGTLTVRGEAPAEFVPRYQQELKAVRGADEVLNFVHAPS